MTQEEVLKRATRAYTLERATGAYNRQKDEEQRKVGPDPKMLGPRISKLDKVGLEAEVLSRIKDKPEYDTGTAGEFQLETTSAEPIVGVGESALSLSSGMVTWGMGKVFAVGPRLLGDTHAAKQIEDIVNNLAYQPRTETGRELVGGVSRGIDIALTPVHWYGQKIQESLIDPMREHGIASERAISATESFKWFAELAGELATFKGIYVLGQLPKNFKARYQNIKLAKSMGLKNYYGKDLFWNEQLGSLREIGEPVEVLDPTGPGGRGGEMGVSPEAVRRGTVIELHDVTKPGSDPIQIKSPAEIDHYKTADTINKNLAIVERGTDGVGTLVRYGDRVNPNRFKIPEAKTLASTTMDRPTLVHLEKDGVMSKFSVEKGGENFGEIRVIDNKDGTGKLNASEKPGLSDTEKLHIMNEVRKANPGIESWDMTFDRPEGIHQAQYSPDAFDYEPLKKQVNRAVKKGLEVRDLILERHGDIAVDEVKSHLYTEGIKERFPNVSEREAVPFIIEKTKIENYEARLNSLVEEGRISPETAEHAKNPSPELQREIVEISKYYKDAHEFLAEHHDGMGFTENYVNRIWDLDKANSAKMGSYFSTNMPNAKGRTIPSLVEGIEAGYRPKTLDIAELISVYDSYKIKTSYNSRFANGIFDLVDPEIGKLLNTYNRIPKEHLSDFVELDHHALKKAVYRGKTTTGMPMIEMANVWAHKDIAPFLNNIFGKKARGYGIGYLEGANAVLKKSNLALSFFHHVALTEAGAGWGIATKAFTKSIKGMAEGKPYAMSTPELQRLTMDAVKHTVRIDPIPDHHVGQVQSMLDRISRSLKDKSGSAGVIAEALAKGNKYWDAALWDYYHSTMKLMAYEKGVHAELGRLAKDGTLMEKTSTEISKIKREVAQFVNDSFGGQVWETFEHLGNPKVQQVLQLSFLSPDWTLSTLRQAQALFAKGPRGRMGRKFWIRSAAIMFSMLQAVNYASSHRLYGEGRFTWNNPKNRKTYALLPWRGKDGQELYLRIGKQFREAPEMVFHPMEKLGGKMSPLAQIGVEQFVGASPGTGFPAEWKRKPHESNTLLRLKALAEKTTPFSLRSFISGQQAPLAGSIPISKGMSAWTAREQLVEALQAGKTGEELSSLKRQIVANNLDYDTILSTARGEVTRIQNYKYRELARNIMRRVKSGSASLADVLEIEREKSGLPPKEWRQVIKQFRALRGRERRIRRQRSRIGLPDIGY